MATTSSPQKSLSPFFSHVFVFVFVFVTVIVILEDISGKCSLHLLTLEVTLSLFLPLHFNLVPLFSSFFSSAPSPKSSLVHPTMRGPHSHPRNSSPAFSPKKFLVLLLILSGNSSPGHIVPSCHFAAFFLGALFHPAYKYSLSARLNNPQIMFRSEQAPQAWFR